jgi:hypothetical protein
MVVVPPPTGAGVTLSIYRYTHTYMILKHVTFNRCFCVFNRFRPTADNLPHVLATFLSLSL